jgi:uncharacterized membrane protein
MSRAPATARLPGLDAARGLAVLAMFAYHFIWDLGYFRYVDPAFPYTPGFKAFGHAIAASFLFVAGAVLVLAHGDGMRWRSFARRLAVLTGAALLVSAGTYAAFPKSWVFFGILHCIAAASLLALPFLRASWPAPLAAALAAAAAPMVLSSPVFDAPWLQWVGLSTVAPLTNDYRPLLPWSGALLLGVAAARLRRASAPRARPARAPAGFRGASVLGFLGRHSLALYLLHQPAFFALLYGAALVLPPSAPDGTADFVAACATRCGAAGGAADFCRASCLCTAQEAARRLLENSADEAERARRLDEAARDCAARARRRP